MVVDLAFSPDGARLVSASADASSRVWDAATGVCLHVYAPNLGAVYSVCISPEGLLAIGFHSGAVRIYLHPGSDELVKAVHFHDSVPRVRFAPARGALGRAVFVTASVKCLMFLV